MDLLNLVQGITPGNDAILTIYGEPKSKQRPMVTRRGTFTRPETVAAEKNVVEAWRKLGLPKFQHHLVVSIDFYSGTRRRRDLDNMAKLILDALNKEAYDDDSQIIELYLRKFLTDKERARTVMHMHEVVLWPYE